MFRHQTCRAFSVSEYFMGLQTSKLKCKQKSVLLRIQSFLFFIKLCSYEQGRSTFWIFVCMYVYVCMYVCVSPHFESVWTISFLLLQSQNMPSINIRMLNRGTLAHMKNCILGTYLPINLPSTGQGFFSCAWDLLTLPQQQLVMFSVAEF